MTQLGIITDSQQDLKKIVDEYLNDLNANLKEILNNGETWKEVGFALYDSGFVGALNVINRDYFGTNFDAIFNYYASGASLNGYIGFFKSIFGGDAEVVFDFETDNRILNINVITGIQEVEIATESGEVLVDEQGRKIVVGTLFPELTNAQTIQVLELIKPVGITLNISITDN